MDSQAETLSDLLTILEEMSKLLSFKIHLNAANLLSKYRNTSPVLLPFL